MVVDKSWELETLPLDPKKGKVRRKVKKEVKEAKVAKVAKVESEAKKAFRALIEIYAEKNPAKYADKKEALFAKLETL